MASRRFNIGDADKELAELRKQRPSMAIPTDCDTTGNGSSASSGVGTLGLLRRSSSSSATGVGGGGSRIGSSSGLTLKSQPQQAITSSAASSALYNVLLSDSFRPDDAQPVLSKALAVQIKDLRRLETQALEDFSEEISGYQYDQERALRDRLMGLDTVQTGMLPRRKETRDDGGGIEWSEGNPTAKALAAGVNSNGPMVDEDGNMACGTDDLEDYIRQQQQATTSVGGAKGSSSSRDIVKTVAEVPRNVTEMALGAVLDDFIDRFALGGGAAGSSRPVSGATTGRSSNFLFATSAKGPAVSIFQNTTAASTAPEDAPTKKPSIASSGLVPSPPRSMKPPSSAGGLSRVDNDLYSIKAPSSSGGIGGGLGTVGRGGAAAFSGLSSLRATKAGGTLPPSATASMLPSQSTRAQPLVAGGLRSGSRGGLTAKPQTAPLGANKGPASTAASDPQQQQLPQKLYVHTEYLGNNTIAFCPTCRHCVDISKLKQEQQVASSDKVVCPRCGELWVDKALVVEQKAIEDAEASAFQQAVMEWRNASKRQAAPSASSAAAAPTSGGGSAEGGGSVGVGSDKPLPKKGVRIPKGLYFQHLWKCLEARE